MGTDGKPVFHEYAFLPDIPLSLSLRGVYMASVQLQQPLFYGREIRAAHQAAKFGEELAEENIRLNRSEVLVELEQAYWQCVRVQELVLVARKYKSVVNELVKNLEDAQQAGMAPLNDVLKAQVKYNDALLQLQQAEHGKQLAQRIFVVWWDGFEYRIGTDRFTIGHDNARCASVAGRAGTKAGL